MSSPALFAAAAFEEARLARLEARFPGTGKDEGFSFANVPNAITLSGYASAIAWLAGGSPMFAVWSVLADELDGVAARNLGQASSLGDRLDWGADVCLLALLGMKVGLGWLALPAVLLGQTLLKESGHAPPFGSARAMLTGYALL